MAKVKKKYIIAGVIGLVSIAGGILYLQAKKLLENFTWDLKRVKVRTLTPRLVSFDVFLEFVNASNITINIVSQEYRIFVNGMYISRGSNGMNNEIRKESRSELATNIQFDPKVVWKALKLNATDLLTAPENVKIDVQMKFRIRIGWFPFTVPYTFKTDMKELKSWYF